MKLLVGLGNPGQKYERNRHNIGFMAVEEIARVHSFAPWRSRFKGFFSEGLIDGNKCLLLKPSTFMNLSGEAVRAAIQFYKIPLEDLIVLHDEIDIAPGKIRVKSGGGNAGHNGLKSISQHLGNDYVRVRLGVGRPVNKGDVANYVLRDFAKAEQPWLDEMISSVARHAARLVTTDLGGFASHVGQDVAPLLSDGKTEPPAGAKRLAVKKNKDGDSQDEQKSARLTGAKKQNGPEASALGAALKNWLKKGDGPDGL